MKLNKVTKAQRGGFTLIEITLVISLILGLITVLVVGAQAFREGSDRARCIMNIGNVQKAVRSWANLNEYNAGETTTASLILTTGSDISGTGKFLESEPDCPGTVATTGDYTPSSATVVPPIGTVHAVCSQVTDLNHSPKGSTNTGSEMKGW